MPEKEYIEREAMNNILDELMVNDSVYNALQAIPAADVEPVRHGHWIQTANTWTHDYYKNKLIYKCSLCGRYEKIKEPYCNCGAKMNMGGGEEK